MIPHPKFDRYESDRPQPLPHDTIPCAPPDFADHIRKRVFDILEHGDEDVEGNLFDSK